jgi:hypothetical protein
MRFEPMTPGSEKAKTVHAFDSVAIMASGTVHVVNQRLRNQGRKTGLEMIRDQISKSNRYNYSFLIFQSRCCTGLHMDENHPSVSVRTANFHFQKYNLLHHMRLKHKVCDGYFTNDSNTILRHS